MSNLQRRTNDAHMIWTWLNKQGIKATTKTTSNLTANFLKSKGLPYKKFNPRYKGLFTADINNASEVLEYFAEFKKFVLDSLLSRSTNTNVESTI